MATEPTPAAVDDDVPSLRTTPRGNAETVAILAVFALYATFLLKLLLLSRVPGSERWVNLVPFATIAHYALGHSFGTAFANVGGNILVFIPLGGYVAWLGRRASAWLPMLTVASVSIAVEVVQWVLAVGASDIDDVILNCVGGLVGILAARLLASTLREPSRVRSALAVLSLLTAPVWGYFLFGIRLRM